MCPREELRAHGAAEADLDGAGSSRRHGARARRPASTRTRALFDDGPAGLRRRARPAALGAAPDLAGRHAHPRSTSRRSTSTCFTAGRRWRAAMSALIGCWRDRGGAGRTTPLTMARDTNFYYSFLVLPAEQARAIVAVWDFCRAVDDAVDEAGEPRSAAGARSRAWRARSWRRCFEGGTPETPQGRALAAVDPPVSTCRAQPFDALIDGVAMDLGDRALRDVRRPVSSTASASRRRSA